MAKLEDEHLPSLPLGQILLEYVLYSLLRLPSGAECQVLTALTHSIIHSLAAVPSPSSPLLPDRASGTTSWVTTYNKSLSWDLFPEDSQVICSFKRGTSALGFSFPSTRYLFLNLLVMTLALQRLSWFYEYCSDAENSCHSAWARKNHPHHLTLGLLQVCWPSSSQWLKLLQCFFLTSRLTMTLVSVCAGFLHSNSSVQPSQVEQRYLLLKHQQFGDGASAYHGSSYSIEHLQH